MIITRIDPTSCARISALVYAVIGFLVGVLTALLSFVGGGLFGSRFGIAAIIVLPILYGVFGFIGTYIGVLIYNAAAQRVGGIEMDMQ